MEACLTEAHNLKEPQPHQFFDAAGSHSKNIRIYL